MSTPDSKHLSVLATYPNHFSPIRTEFLGSAGGFSGAKLWRIETAWGKLCLRQWPSESPTLEELEFIHAVLGHVYSSGFHLVPVPYANRFQRTWVCYGDHLWELSPWLSGRPDFRKVPSTERLQAALLALAEFHRKAATFPSLKANKGPSTALRQRCDQLRRWLDGELSILVAAIRPGLWPELEVSARRILKLVPVVAGSVVGQLGDCIQRVVPLQPCIRDIWCEHVLFEGTRIAGFVDFGSMSIDTVACDVARLLGSMALDDRTMWRIGLEAYQSVRRLSENEVELISAFDRSTVLMAGLNWLDWIYRQHRVFENGQAIPGRLREIADRLENLSHQGGKCNPGPDWRI